MFLSPQVPIEQEFARFPPDNQWITSPQIVVYNTPELFFRQAVHNTIRGLKSCFNPMVVNHIAAMKSDLALDETFAVTRGRVHRPRSHPKRMADHVALSTEDYTTIVRTFIRAGFAVKVTPEVQAELLSTQFTKPSELGFNAKELKAAVREITWLDHEIVEMLTFGGHEYSPNTPPVSWFTPHSASVYKHWSEFSARVPKEIWLTWMEGPWKHIHTVTFRIVPSTVLPKPRRTGKFREIRNASVTGMHFW